MKKLLLALVASATALTAFANETVVTNGSVGNQQVVSSHNSFDSTNIVCSGQKIGTSANVNELRGRCKEFSVQHTNVTFYDENSKKVVHCKSSKSGDIAVTECKAGTL